MEDDMAPRPIRVLELCAGYGGFSLGLRLTGRATRTVCMVEREAYAAALLAKAMGEGRLDPCPIWSDLCTFDARAWRGAVDLVTAGFPCQPFSLAGKQLGEADERWIWPDIARIVDECRPGLVFLENVVLDAFRRPRADLEDLGYRVRPALRVSASDVGAPHRRDRWFVLGVLADAVCAGLETSRVQVGPGEEHAEPSDGGADAADANDQGQQQPQGLEPDERGRAGDCGWWQARADVRRVSDECPDRVDRLRMLGNGVLPLAVAVAFDALLADEVTYGG